MRTPEDAALEKAQGIMSGTTYAFLERSEQNAVLDLVKNHKGFQVANINVLLAAGAWRVSNPKRALPESSKEISIFLKKVADSEVHPVDLVRYIRAIDAAKKR